MDINEYLHKLSSLAGVSVGYGDLSSKEDARLIRDRSIPLCKLPVSQSDISFSCLRSNSFSSCVAGLFEKNPSRIYIWLEESIHFGVISVPSILAINFSFDFSIDDNGVIVFLTKDCSDRLLLDLYSDEAGSQRVLIEAQGKNWHGVCAQFT